MSELYSHLDEPAGHGLMVRGGPWSRLDQPGPYEIVLRDHRRMIIGRLRFRACTACRTGRILDIWVHETHQRRGLGRELVHVLLARFRGFRWSTTPQSRQGRSFFPAMTRETAVPLPCLAPLCPHLRGPLRQACRRAIARCRRPSP
jgi:GNAT superfamily N-acetyltransferase